MASDPGLDPLQTYVKPQNTTTHGPELPARYVQPSWAAWLNGLGPLRPTEVVGRSQPGSHSKNQEDGACVFDREVEDDEGDHEEGEDYSNRSIVHGGQYGSAHMFRYVRGM